MPSQHPNGVDHPESSDPSAHDLPREVVRRLTNRSGEAVPVPDLPQRPEPDSAEGQFRLGLALQASGRTDRAITSYLEALRLDSDFAPACNRLGNSLADRSEHELAEHYLRRAVRLRPGAADLHSSLLYNLDFHPDLDPASILAERTEWARRHSPPSADAPAKYENERSQERRLRIGYVSPDFREHAVGRNLFPLLREHDRAWFEVFCYSDVLRPDALTERLRSMADGWRSLEAVTDEHAARIIRKDRIDILVDLAAHSDGNRLCVFGRKPAPIQISLPPYPGSSGSSRIDYRFTDPFLDPPELDPAAPWERPIRLSHGLYCYDPAAFFLESEALSSPSTLPALERRLVTFGFFGHPRKLNATVLRTWAKILKAVERSRLLLLAPEGLARWNITNLIRAEGVESKRLEFLAPLPLPEYLHLYRSVDIALDAFPYNARTASLDSFWMGVPVVTRLGHTPVGRIGFSQANLLGLPELVASTTEEFIQLAVTLASDLPRLSALRNSLRERFLGTPLADAGGFARGIEAAYRQIWRAWLSRNED